MYAIRSYYANEKKIHAISLLRVFNGAGFANDIDLDLPGVGHLFFDFLGNVAGHHVGVFIGDHLAGDQNPDLAAGLNSKAAFASGHRGADPLEVFEPLDVGSYNFV